MTTAATPATAVTMRAARLHEVDGELRLSVDSDVAVPRPDPGEVLLRVRSCGLNQVDLLTRTGQTPQSVPLPHISGTEVAGDVVDASDAAGEPWVGRRVVVDPVVACGECRSCFQGRTNQCRVGRIFGVQTPGGYAEYVAAPVRQLVAIPDGMSYEQAAAVAVTGPTTWHMLRTRAGLTSGEDVLVIAAGSGIGSLATQVAKHAGARVIATVGGSEKVQKAQSMLPVDLVVDHANPDWSRKVREFTGGKGADLVFEHVGAATWPQSLASMARGGRLVTSGGHSGFEVDVNLWHLFIKEHTLIGSYAGTRDDFLTILDLNARGVVAPIIQEVFTLEQISDAQGLLESRQVFGKLLLDPTK